MYAPYKAPTQFYKVASINRLINIIVRFIMEQMKKFGITLKYFHLLPSQSSIMGVGFWACAYAISEQQEDNDESFH